MSATGLGLLPAAAIVPRLEPVYYGFAQEDSAFVRGANERALRFTLDLDGLGDSDALDLLLEFGRHPDVELTTTKDVGFSTLRIADTLTDGDVIEAYADHCDGSRTHWGVRGASTWLRFADEHAGIHGLDPDEARRRYLLAAAVSHRTDGLVLSETSFVHDVAHSSNPMTARQAAALLGLFLRSRGHMEWSIVAGWGRKATGIGTQYWNVARVLMPAAWRWWSACVVAGETASGEDAMGAGQAILTRFPRCMRARDEVLYRCLAPFSQSEGDGILYHLDALLLMLSGAVDATARVANVAYDLGIPNHQVGWRYTAWRDRLRAVAPEPHALTDSGTPARRLIDLIALARNTIHGEPLSQVHYSRGSTAMHLVQIPDRVAAAIHRCVDDLGGMTLWGLLHPQGGLALLDPQRFVQVIIPFAAATLDSIMAATAVERLPGVQGAELLAGPSSDNDFFEPSRVRHLCLLVGLGA